MRVCKKVSRLFVYFCVVAFVMIHNLCFRVTMTLIKQNPLIINDEDDCSNTPLHLAALNGHIKVVELLLNQGASIDAR